MHIAFIAYHVIKQQITVNVDIIEMAVTKKNKEGTSCSAFIE